MLTVGREVAKAMTMPYERGLAWLLRCLCSLVRMYSYFDRRKLLSY